MKLYINPHNTHKAIQKQQQQHKTGSAKVLVKTDEFVYRNLESQMHWTIT